MRCSCQRRSALIARQLTGNGHAGRRIDLTARLQLQGDGTLAGGLPAERSGRTSLEGVATRGVVERVGSLGHSEGRTGSKNEVDDRTHGGDDSKDRVGD